jgi:hypothetical protein
MMAWATSNRVIAFQRVLRKLDADEIAELDGTTIHALDAGKTIKSRSERIRAYTAMGIPENIAELAIDNPGKFMELMSNVENSNE